MIELGQGCYKDFTFGANPAEPSMEYYGYYHWFVTGNVARSSHKTPANFFLKGKSVGPVKGFFALLF